MNLTAENISVTIGGKEILQDVSYEFSSGKRTAITGPNAAEKVLVLALTSDFGENLLGART